MTFDEEKIKEMFEACTTDFSSAKLDLRLTRYDLFSLAVKSLLSEAYIEGAKFAMTEFNKQTKINIA